MIYKQIIKQVTIRIFNIFRLLMITRVFIYYLILPFFMMA
jgi:hypothetical protein